MQWSKKYNIFVWKVMELKSNKLEALMSTVSK